MAVFSLIGLRAPFFKTKRIHFGAEVVIVGIDFPRRADRGTTVEIVDEQVDVFRPPDQGRKREQGQ